MTLHLCITVSKVYPGPRGGAIFSGRDAGGNNYRFIANQETIFRPPVLGEIWSLEGIIEHHPKYGRQVRVVSSLIKKPSGSLIIDYLIRNPAFAGTGIGRKKAERLWDEFGEELYSILSDADMGKLSLVLTQETAQKLVDAWREATDETEVIRFLSHFGFDASLANKIRRIWPENPIQKLQDNPYRMLAFASWNKVDAAARSLGVGKSDSRRQVAAVEAYLYRRLDAKHTVTLREFVIRGVSTLLRSKESLEAEIAVQRALHEYAIAPLGREGLQPLGAAVMEKTVAERLRAMLSRDELWQRNLFSTCLDTVVAQSKHRFEGDLGIHLTDEQKAAAAMAASLPLSIITGGAGVGKTTVLKLVHEICEHTGTSVTQTALSGRAAQRMREATAREAFTIAKFLKLAERGKVCFEKEALLIIDEASMLDLPLMYSIIRLLPEGARLLLVGDPYQLPPIGFGLVFHILAASPSIPIVELSHVHRQAHSSGIPRVAYNVRYGSVPHLQSFDGVTPGVFFIEAGADEILDRIDFVRTRMQDCADVQILGVTKRGTSGILNINSTFHAIHSNSTHDQGGWHFLEGEPVIHTVNDYKNELWNGSLGRVVEVRKCSGKEKSSARSVVCEFEGRRLEFNERDLNHINLAYAITVHKAQGSQFERVIVPIVKSRLLDRTLIYTALTRGVQQVVFIGDKDAFDHAVRSQPNSLERMVGFSL